MKDWIIYLIQQKEEEKKSQKEKNKLGWNRESVAS